MKKYQFKRKKEQNEEYIKKHKDFGKLLNDYETLYKYGKMRTPLYRNKKFGLLALLVGIIILTILFSEKELLNKEIKKQSKQAYTLKKNKKSTQ